MAWLRTVSFSAWRALSGVASTEELAWAFDGTCTRERLKRANEAMYNDRIRLQRLDDLLHSISLLVPPQ